MKTQTCIALAWSLVAALSAGCDDSGVAGGTDAGSKADVLLVADAQADPGGPLGDGDGPPGASGCRPQVRRFLALTSPHILPTAYDASVYNSNPPSSGPHCNAWGQYATFGARPLPRCNYIHNLEHGAVVLLYKCPNGCPEVTAAFADLIANYDHDAFCRVPRLIVTADPDLDTKVAASAWGAIFTAECLDAPALAMLAQFSRDHYNRAPEDVCAGGGVAP